MRTVISLSLFVLVSPAFAQPADDEQRVQAAEIRTLLRLLDHDDQGMREQALQGLISDTLDATPALVDVVLTANEKRATLAGVVLITRLTTGKKALTLPAPAEPAPLDRLEVLLCQSAPVEDWRWCLAASVLDEADPPSASRLLDAYVRAIDTAQPLRTLAAVTAVYHWGSANPGRRHEPLRRSLLRLVSRPGRPPLHGLYLRDKRVVTIDNAVGFTSDRRVYDTSRVAAKYYSHDDLLILDAARAVGASAADVSPRLLELLAFPDENVQFQACQQLARLDAAGRIAAARVVRQLLANPHSHLPRRLADEESRVLERLSANSAEPPKPLADEQAAKLPVVVVFQDLKREAAATVPALIGLLRSGDAGQRHMAAYLLERMDSLNASQRRAAADAVNSALDLESYLNKQSAGRKEVAEKRVATMERALAKLRPKTPPSVE